MNRGKILVIDDEDKLRKALSRIIELVGYGVMQSENATKGVKLLQGNIEIQKNNELEKLEEIFEKIVTEAQSNKSSN